MSTSTERDDAAGTGRVDEAAFKALHEHSSVEAPPLRGETVELGGGQAYLAMPEGAEAPLPGVVVVHEWWGLNDNIRHWTDRLAAEGFAAVAVDLYGGSLAREPDEAMKLMRAVDPDAAQAMLRAAHEFLASEPRIAAQRRGVVGWCFGGSWSLRHAIATADLDAAVVYYGQPVTDPAELSKIQAELLGVFGNLDRSIPPETVDAFVAAVEEAGKTIEVHRYDADHAFANPSSARYQADAAADAWDRVRAFLVRELGD